MIVYRITHSLYKDDLSGTGAKQYGARWNRPGSSMLYTGEHLSLCALELLVHMGWKDMQRNFWALNIFIPDDASIKLPDLDKLKSGWKEDPDYTAYIGTAFLRSNEQLMMKVPSAVVPDEFNYLVNPAHPEFRKVKIRKSNPFIFDERLAAFK